MLLQLATQSKCINEELFVINYYRSSNQCNHQSSFNSSKVSAIFLMKKTLMTLLLLYLSINHLIIVISQTLPFQVNLIPSFPFELCMCELNGNFSFLNPCCILESSETHSLVFDPAYHYFSKSLRDSNLSCKGQMMNRT